MMRERLEILKRLLREDGAIWVSIDDNEGHYLKVLVDEVFGRANSREDRGRLATFQHEIITLSGRIRLQPPLVA